MPPPPPRPAPRPAGCPADCPAPRPAGSWARAGPSVILKIAPNPLAAAALQNIERRLSLYRCSNVITLSSCLSARGSGSRGLQAFGNFLLFNGAGPDETPVRLGDIDGGGARSAARAPVDHQVHAPIHHTENIDDARSEE